MIVKIKGKINKHCNFFVILVGERNTWSVSDLVTEVSPINKFTDGKNLQFNSSILLKPISNG
jgi:hypothetical protein